MAEMPGLMIKIALLLLCVSQAASYSLPCHRVRCHIIATAADDDDELISSTSGDIELKPSVTGSPIDTAALRREMDEDSYRSATKAEIAEYLPQWAAEMMLDEDANEEYEEKQVKRRAAELHRRRVEGRDWEELDAFAGEGAGMSEFTPEELAEDYALPLETIVAQMLSLGVDPKRLKTSSPVKGVCSQSQLTELLGFLGSTDPIAAREALCESTLDELAEALPLSSEQLLALCQREQIGAVLGVETRIQAEDYASLIDSVEREIAFGGYE